jgi:hypothetical protein
MRTDFQKVVAETIRASLPEGLSLKGAGRDRWYKIIISKTRRCPVGGGTVRYHIAHVLAYPSGIVRGSIKTGFKRDKNHVPKPTRVLKVDLIDPTSIDTIEQWAAGLGGVSL